MPEVGERRTRKDGQAYAEWNGSVWVERPLGPAGTKPRPEYGAGSYETPDGAILKPGKSGNVQVLRGAQTAGAEARTRLKLGLGPTIEAQKNLYAAEGWNPDAEGVAKRGSNPLDTFRGMTAEAIRPEEPGNSIMTRVSRQVGGQRYQDYNQASKSFEAAFMPILSGAAVTDSEAERMIAAALPQPGDTTATLARKAKQRAMMINGAAELLGEPKPFPRIESMQFQPRAEQQQEAQAPSPAADRVRRYNPETGRIE